MFANLWEPTSEQIHQTHLFQSMKKLGFSQYEAFHKWSVTEQEVFWTHVLEILQIPFVKKPDSILDLSDGVTQAHWLAGARMNIVDACFTAPPEKTAILFKPEEQSKPIQKWSYLSLEKYVNRIANGLVSLGLQPKDVIAIDLPMHVEAVAIYLAAIKAGLVVATIADSFTPQEIAVRLEITKPKWVFTQDYISRSGKKLPLYEKFSQFNDLHTIVISSFLERIALKKGDLYWENFLGTDELFETIVCDPEDATTILFSSGTTATPKAIPWTHITPLKSAMDGYYHQDIHPKDVVAWPTNLGWMMGPWLVFAGLINGATIAMYGGAPMGKDFGTFVQDAQVTMLGLVPSMVKSWKSTACMEGLNWAAIKCFSSTGEASNAAEYQYLSKLASNKPIIEYCGGTEIGGGYITSTLIHNNIASTFSSKALASDFVLLDENFHEQAEGEVFILPPSLGMSNSLLNKNHHDAYYKGLPIYKGKVLRKHGDQMVRLSNGYFKAQGRADDAMNLGGIKVSSIQIEELINGLDWVKESAAIAISPKGGGPEELVIYVVKTGAEPVEKMLGIIAQRIKTQLNPLFKVSDVCEIELLPRTASGKVMRRSLRTQYTNSIST